MTEAFMNMYSMNESGTQEKTDNLQDTAAKAEGAGNYEPDKKEELIEVQEALANAEGTEYKGALDVEYGQFAKQYKYISNLGKRFSYSFILIMVSLEVPEGELPQPEQLDHDMFYMEQSIRQTIRHVDVMTKYGSHQFLIILVGTDHEGAKIAADRIFGNYYKMNPGSAHIPSYFVAGMEKN